MAVDARSRMGPIQAGIVLAALFTAGVHAYLFVTQIHVTGWLPWGFLAASLGFLALMVALYAPAELAERFRPLTRLALMGLTIATMIGYVEVMGWVFDRLAIADKVDEGLLVVLIVAEAWVYRPQGWMKSSRSTPRASATRVM